MKLSEKQQMFTRMLVQLITEMLRQGYQVTLGSGYCEPGEGKHMKGSLHYRRLAQDLNLFKDGVYLTKTEDHAPFGKYWESLHPDCRWGGRFTDPPDGNHYSIAHEGKA